MWILRAMRMPCGRIPEVLPKQKHIRLQMGATWHFMAGPRMATSGLWKTSKQGATRFCRLPSYTVLFSLSKPDLRLYLDHTGGDIRVEPRSQNTGWSLLLIKNLAKRTV
jgi:hypothetical protein